MEAIVCASCPEMHNERVAQLCRQHGIQKAFGRTGDMVDDLSGRDWVPKWEAKVVIATVTKAQTLEVPRAKILCIAGGRHCDAEMARQPRLVQAIKKEMEDPSFRVSVEWLEIEDFFDRFPEKGQAAKTSGDSKDGQAGQRNDDGSKAYPSAEKLGGKNKKAGPQDQGSEISKPPPAGKAAGKDKAAPQGKGKAKDSGSETSKPPPAGKAAGKDKAAPQGKGKPKDQGSETSKPPPAGKAAGKDNAAPQGKGKPKDQDSNQTQSQSQSQTPCWHFAQGNCKNGSGCPYLHQVTQGAKDQSSEKVNAPASGKAAGKGKTSPKGESSASVSGGKGKHPPKDHKNTGNGDAPPGAFVQKSGDSTTPKASNQGGGGQDPAPVRKAGDASPATPCRHFAQGNCKFGEACTFSHQTQAQSTKTTPCLHFAQGNCKFGSGCMYLHQSSKAAASANVCKEVPTKNKKGQQGAAESKKASTRTLPCLECGRKFKDWDDMKSKHFLCNGREPLFVCTQCNKSFDTDTSCSQHQASTGHKGCARANDNGVEVWECEQCKKTFSTPEACEQHQRMVGHGNTPACAVCNKVFEFETSLLQHQRSTKHKGVTWLMHDNGVRSDSDESSVEDMADAKIACSCGRLFYDIHAAVEHRAATGHNIMSLNPNITLMF